MSTSALSQIPQDLLQRAEGLIDQAWQLLGLDPAVVKRYWQGSVSPPLKKGHQISVVFQYRVGRDPDKGLRLEISFMELSNVWRAQGIMGTTKPNGGGFDFFISIRRGKGPETFLAYAGAFPYPNIVQDAKVRDSLSA